MRLWSLHPRYLDAKGLVALWREALLARAVLAGRTRGYRFEGRKSRDPGPVEPIPVTAGQLLYEWRLLLRKLDARDPERRRFLSGTAAPAPHPCMVVVPGEVEPWERPAPGQVG